MFGKGNGDKIYNGFFTTKVKHVNQLQDKHV